MTKTINALDILAGLKSAVDRAGADTTRTCYYVQESEPGKFEAHCIAGTVLADLGAPLAVLHEYEDVSVPGIKDRNPAYGMRGDGPELPFELTRKAWEVLETAQSVQDDGYPWGRAFESAVDTARSLGVPNIPTDY